MAAVAQSPGMRCEQAVAALRPGLARPPVAMRQTTHQFATSNRISIPWLDQSVEDDTRSATLGGAAG